MYGEKIKTIRELRSFSQEYMASQLNIAQNTYSKIETGQTKLSAITLDQIATLLGVSPIDILSNQPALINFRTNEVSNENGQMQQFTELVQTIISSKDVEIDHLKQIIAGLLKDKEIMFEYFKR